MSLNRSSNFPDYGATDSRFGAPRNARPQPKANFGKIVLLRSTDISEF